MSGSVTHPVPLASVAERVGPYLGDWIEPQLGVLLLGIITFAVVGTTVLFAASVLMYRRRGRTRDLLVVVIIGALVARSLVGMGTVFGLTPMPLHHLIEHSFDFLIALVILYAVYHSRSLAGDTD